MPPRAKKPVAAKGPKRTARATKKPDVKPEDVKEEVRVEEVKDDVDVAEENNHDKGSTDLNVEPKSEANGSVSLKSEFNLPFLAFSCCIIR